MSEKTIAIKYNGKMGEVGDSPYGSWTKGEIKDVPESMALLMLETGNYDRKGERIVKQDEFLEPTIPPLPEPKAAKKKRR